MKRMTILLLCLALLACGAALAEKPVELDLSVLSGTVVYSQVYDMMMLEGGFCRVGEIPFEKLSSFTNDDFETTFRKYSDALEGISKEIAQKTNRYIDPNSDDKPSEAMLAGYWDLLHKEFFAAFLCGINAGLLLQDEGAQLDVKGGVSVQIEYGKCLNLALAQNKFPLITSLKIKNVTAEKVDGLTCRISSPEEFFQTTTVETGPLWPEAETELGSVKLTYNLALFRRLEDAQPGSLRIEVVRGGRLWRRTSRTTSGICQCSLRRS